ncbi:MAG: 30S ribosomal protein S8 [Candidatus Aenigmatarchaeota archaeon]
MRHSILADCMSALKNAEDVGKDRCTVQASGLVTEVLKTLQDKGYIGEFELIEDNRGGKLRIKMIGKINDCNIIRPHFSVKKDNFEEWEKRFLPAKGMGYLLVSTSQGIKTHEEAKEEEMGGKLMAYVY